MSIIIYNNYEEICRYNGGVFRINFFGFCSVIASMIVIMSIVDNHCVPI